MTTLNLLVPQSRPVSWIAAALRDFKRFPQEAQTICERAITTAAEGGKADIAKPFHGFGPGVFEIALPYKGDAYRVVYAVRIADRVWVLHAFQKKSKAGIKTPKREVELIRARLKAIKEYRHEKG